MDGQTLFEANEVIADLASKVQRVRFSEGRRGMLPPEDIAVVEADLRKALRDLAHLREVDAIRRMRP